VIKQFRQNAASRVMPLLTTNEPFCCVHCSRDSQCFSTDGTTSKNAPMQLSPQPVSRSVQPFSAGLTNVSNWQTDRQTHRPRYSICSIGRT